MAAYAQQQRPQHEQQQFNHAGYAASPPPVANGYQGQHNQGRSDWQVPATQRPNQAWEQSQLYDYQPVQAQAPREQPQQPPVQQYQYAQPQHQQSDGASPHRQSSFVGLPPIRRTSTLLGSVVNVGEDDNDAASTTSSQQAGRAPSAGGGQGLHQSQFAGQTPATQQYQGTPQQYQITGGYRPNPLNAGPQSQDMMQQGAHGPPQPHNSFQQGSPGLQGRAFSGPVHPQGIAVPNGETRLVPQPDGQGQGLTPQNIPPVLRQTASPVSPNAGGHIRLPPQGAWKLEESHLQQPLLSPSRNRSPSNATTPTSQNQPFYGFDKETGLPSPLPSPSQQQQAPQPGRPQPGQVERSGTIDTVDSDLPPPSRVQTADERQSKRNSGLFSNFRGRFSREGPEERRDSASAHGGHPMSDAISESSVATEELQERRKRHSLFGGHGSSNLSQPAHHPSFNGPPSGSPLANAGVHNAQRVENQPPLTAYDQRIQQAAQPQQLPLTDKKKTFFGLGHGAAEQQPPALRPDMSRASTSSNTITQADAGPPSGAINGGPKKRFSGLTTKMFNRSSSNLNGQQPPGSSHSARQSFSHGPPPGGPPGGPQGGAQSFSGGFNGGFGGTQQGQFARSPGGPGPMSAQQQQQQQQRQQGPPQGPQGVPGQQGQQPPTQQPQQFQQGQQTLPGQQLVQSHQGGQQNAQPGSMQMPGSEGNGQRSAQGQQSPFLVGQQRQSPNPGQQQQWLAQQPQQPGQQQPGQQQFGQQQFGQQRPGPQQQPSQQSFSQQPQQYQQQQQQRPVQQQLGQQQPGPMGSMGPPPPLGRGRTDSMGSRPFTPGESRPNPMMQHSSSSIGEEQRGRKPSGGGFFSSIFGGRTNSKPRDSKPTQNQGHQQGPLGGPQQPGQPQYAGQTPGQQSNQYAPGQHRLPSGFAQQQQQGFRPIGQPGQFPGPQPGQQHSSPAQSASNGEPGLQRIVDGRQVSGQQPSQAPAQQPGQKINMQGGPVPQSGQAPGGGFRPPVMYPQLQSQQSQASIASAAGRTGQQQPGLTNGQRTPSVSQLHPTQQGLAQDAIQRTAPGPLNQHPPQGNSAPTQETLREDTVSPPIDDSASKAGARGSSPLTSPISQVSTTVPFTPVERQSNDSPLSFRQSAPQQQQTSQAEVPRPSFQTSTPVPPTQSLARKPIQSGPRPPQPSASPVHGGSDGSKGSPSISYVHTATAAASPVDQTRRPSQQFGQLAPQQTGQTGSPLAQQPQLAAAQQQPMQRLSQPGQTPAPQPQFGQPAGFPGQQPHPGVHGGQSQGGPLSQTPGIQQGVRLVGQQQQGQSGMPAAAQQGQQGQQGQPYPGPQSPWMAGRTSTGPSPAAPQQGRQQVPGPYFDGRPQNNVPDKEPKGTISKLFNKAKEVTHTGSGQDKEKGGKSRLGFLRSSKQPEQRQQPLQGGPQFQGPPGRQVMPQESQLERLHQLQSQISPSDPQPKPSPTPSPQPHLNYQHQRQSPPNGNSPQTLPTAGSTPSPGPQQALSPAQGPPARGAHQQQGPTVVAQQGVPRPAQGQPAQAVRPGPHAAGGFAPVSQPVYQRPPSAQHTAEPRYGEVPIPTGYGKVHSEGRVEPAPVAYYMGPHGQFLPVQSGTPGLQPHVEPWTQPGVAQRQPSYGAAQQDQPRVGQGARPSPNQQTANGFPVASPAASTPVTTPGFPAGGTHPQPPDPLHPLHVQNPDQPPRSALPTPQIETPQPNTAPTAFSPAPASQVQGYGMPTDHAAHSRPEPERFSTAMSNPHGAPSPLPQLQHPGAPQSYPLPDSIFSPVNPAAEHAPPPPLPSDMQHPDPAHSPLGYTDNRLQMAIPQRQVSAVSQVSSLQPRAQAGHNPESAHFGVDAGGYLQARSPSPQATPDRSLSPQPSTLPPPPQSLGINVQQANEHNGDEDNIYDATPRKESMARQEPTEESVVSQEPHEPAVTKADSSFPANAVNVNHENDNGPSPPQNPISDTRTSSASPSPPLPQPASVHHNVTSSESAAAVSDSLAPAARSTPPAAPATAASSNAADIFEEAKRRAVLRDMEEKIPVFPTEPDVDAQQLAQMAAKKKAEEERPQMSATSYPGQEWNPYGDGWEDDD